MKHVRISAGVRAATAIAALALPLAMAGTAFAAPPGDNGDVKIHKVGTPDPEHENQPHVCHFYLDAFNFDTAQTVHWEIDEWAGGDNDAVKGKKAADGDIILKSGDGSTDPIPLPDGHYKLFWNFDGENGAAKHKVFWVECGDPATPSSPSSSSSSSPSSPGGPSSPSGSSPSSNPSSSIAGSTTGGVTGGTTGTPSATGTSPAATASTSPSSGGSLAHTGAGGVLYIAVGAAALGGGGFALRRYAAARAKG